MKAERWILDHLSHGPMLQHADHPRALTLGLEQEAFLVDEKGQPADHGASQAFLEALATKDGWAAGSRESSLLGAMLPEVHWQESPATNSTAKYDHHPHLMELATAPCANLQELEGRLKEAWSQMSQAAATLGFHLALRPQLARPWPSSPLPVFEALRWTRHQVRAHAGLPPDPDIENYAAGIAATQIHVGGLDWRRRPHLVEALYAFEPGLVGWSAEALGPDRANLLRHRWTAYPAAFPGNPLIGFPVGAGWSLETYAEALGRTPLLGEAQDPSAGLPLRECTPSMDWGTFRQRVRDLQILRPRDFGTVEFRADPCQPTIPAILRMAALRLGLAASVLMGAKAPRAYAEAQALWWDRVLGRVPCEPDLDVLARAQDGLRARGLGEETYLQAVSS